MADEIKILWLAPGLFPKLPQSVQRLSDCKRLHVGALLAKVATGGITTLSQPEGSDSTEYCGSLASRQAFWPKQRRPHFRRPIRRRSAVVIVDRASGVFRVTTSTYSGNASGRMERKKCSCAAKLEQAELKSKVVALIPNSAAMVQASAGIRCCGEHPPAMTIPMSLAWSPARLRAMRAAIAPVCELVWEEALKPQWGERCAFRGCNLTTGRFDGSGSRCTDPGFIRADIEGSEEGIVDDVIGMEMSHTVNVKRRILSRKRHAPLRRHE